MTRITTIAALLWALACAAAPAQIVAPDIGGMLYRPLPNHSVKLSGVFVDLPAGTPWLSLSTGATFCLGNPAINKTWPGGRVAQRVGPYRAPFAAILAPIGYKVVTPGEDNVFDSEGGAADYEVAAVIFDQHVEGCQLRAGPFNQQGMRGSATMKIEWQIYSPLRKEIVARVKTFGTAKLEQNAPGGAQELIMAAFYNNVRALATDADFHAAMHAPNPSMAEIQSPVRQSTIDLVGSLKAGHRKIADATGSVVTLIAGMSTGSGFLVSVDGYILTDAHVVGDEKTVRVRWPDGIETLATVERVSKKRDVAIIKTNPRDRAPLALKRGPVTPGARVYAIGSPSGKAFEGTVSSGVVSADRTVDGLRYVQSDTTVSHGSSGGPLLDEKGEVIGLTDLAIPNTGPTGEEGPAGLNLFTPIGDAMDFLSLEQK